MDYPGSESQKTLSQVEHNDDARAKRIIIRAQDPDSGDFVNVSASPNGDGTYSLSDSGTAPLAVRIDDSTTANVTYIGKAPIGTATSAASWQIQKLDESSGLIKTWADGSASFTQVWDDRSSLSYA